MRLKPGFHFSQNNLQDFVDCPRRFELLHVLHLPWPAIQSEPVLEQEWHMELGQRFHQLVHRHQLGLPLDAIESGIDDGVLGTWWQNYLQHQLENIPQTRYPEWMLAAPFAGYRLVAKYDLLAISPGERAVIVDWKTNRFRPKPSTLKERVQTRLYRYLLVKAGRGLYGRETIPPEAVEMIYWFTETPESPICYAYTLFELNEDQKYLQELITSIEILSTKPDPFPMTDDEKQCKFCKFRTLCNRGIHPGNINEPSGGILESEPPEIQIDFDQIGEIEF